MQHLRALPAARTAPMAAPSSLEAVKRKIQCLQQQADEAEDRAQVLQRELDLERDLREKVRPPGLPARLSRSLSPGLPAPSFLSLALSPLGGPGCPVPTPPPRSSAVPSLLRSAAPRGKPRCRRSASPAPCSGGTGLGRGAGCLPLSGPCPAEKAAIGSAERLGVE